MEHILRCNDLTCRKELGETAVVTTCSHVFCYNCASRLNLTNQNNRQRQACPACEAQLTNPDDVVMANLNPTEDYKTSVLSGLSPNVIMECAGRALSFWAYQTSQEIVYQEYQAKILTEKYTKLKSQMDHIIHEANAEITDLRAQLNNAQLDYKNLRHKNEELAQSLRDKARKHAQTQELYDKLKRRAMLGQVQNAASEAVDHTIQASVTADRFVDRVGNMNQPQYRPPLLPSAQEHSMPPPLLGNSNFAQCNGPANALNDGWPGFSNQESNRQSDVSQTPSHRQRLGAGANITIGLGGFQSGRNPSIHLPQFRSPSRSALANVNPNTVGSGGGFAGYGMSAGLKVSHPTSIAQTPNGMARSQIRSRVAQRPASTSFIGGRGSAFQSGNGYAGGNMY